MPPPRHWERDDFHGNRSASPANGKKRSWLSSSSSSHYDRSHRHSPPPKRKDFRSPSRPQHQSSSVFSRRSRSRSRSPKYTKRDGGYDEGLSRHTSKDGFRPRSPNRVNRSDFRSRQDSRLRRSRSSSPVGSSKDRHKNYRDHDDRKLKRSSRSPDHHSIPTKKKSRQSPSPIPPPRSSLASKKHDSSSSRSHEKNDNKDGSLPQRKVAGSSHNKKASRLTLHKRFTEDDIEPFQLQMKDNVTIAILRNPRAEPSDDVTVKRIFDAALFKMVHKKSEGRRPIFDREEIKMWKHDENLEDDFEERRLVRVKATQKRPADSSLRMSPDALRKSLGNKDKSRSQSPRVRLNLQPDSRYESRYQQQIKRDEMRRDGADSGRRGRGGRDDEEDGGRDLRQALERRKSGRDQDFDRGSQHFSSQRNKSYSGHDDRNVVMDQDRPRRFGDDRGERGGRGFDGERRGRGRGRGRGFRRQWSPIRMNEGDRDDFDSRDRGYDRRDRDGYSPGNFRGRGGFRGRGRGRDQSWYEQEDRDNPPAEPSNKYHQHDDRDLSPRSARGGRGRGGRFQSNRGFRGTRGWSFGQVRGRGFRGSGRGRGGYFNRRDSRSPEREDTRSIEHASDREWKHDLYDTVQSDDEMPHSTTVTKEDM